MNLCDKIWLDMIDDDVKASENPVGYVLGGQPGAGKSRLIWQIQKIHKNNIVVINADEFRKYHPLYAEFQKQDDKMAQEKTASFIADIAERLLEKAVKNRFNVVIEGTFRTSQTPIKTLNFFKQSNYRASLKTT